MKEIFSGIKSTENSSGAKIIAIPYGKTPRIIVAFLIRSGAEKDPVGKEGLVDFTIEALSFGTKTRSFEAFHEEIEKYGVYLEMGSMWDVSYIVLSSPNESFGYLIPLYKELFFEPAFPQKEISEAQNRRKAKLQKLSDISSWIADQLIWNLALKGSNYGHCRIGNGRSIENFTIEDFKEFHYKYCLYGPNTCIIIMGKEKADRLLDIGSKIAEGFQESKSSFSEEEPFENPHREGPKVIIVDRPDLTQSEIRVSFPGISRHDPDYYAFTLMNYILGGGGFSSILMDRLRSQKGLTYGVKSNFYPLKIKGPMIISTFTPTAYTFQTFKEILDTIASFSSHQNLEKYLHEGKEFFKGNFPLRFETPEKLLKEVIHLETYKLSTNELVLFPERISEVSLDNIMKLVNYYLKLEQLKAIIVGRAKDFLKDFEVFLNKNEFIIVDYKKAIELL